MPEQRRNALIFYQVLSTNSIRQFIDTSGENLYLDIGAGMLSVAIFFYYNAKRKSIYYQRESNIRIGNQGKFFESPP